MAQIASPQQDNAPFQMTTPPPIDPLRGGILSIEEQREFLETQRLLDEHRKQLFQLTTDIESLEERLRDQVSQAEELERLQQIAQREHDEVLVANVSSCDARERAEHECAQLIQRNDELVREIERLDASIAKDVADHDRASSQLQAMTSEMKDLETRALDLEDLKSKIETSQKSICERRERLVALTAQHNELSDFTKTERRRSESLVTLFKALTIELRDMSSMIGQCRRGHIPPATPSRGEHESPGSYAQHAKCLMELSSFLFSPHCTGFGDEPNSASTPSLSQQESMANLIVSLNTSVPHTGDSLHKSFAAPDEATRKTSLSSSSKGKRRHSAKKTPNSKALEDLCDQSSPAALPCDLNDPLVDLSNAVDGAIIKSVLCELDARRNEVASFAEKQQRLIDESERRIKVQRSLAMNE
jgi:hypothetical protein